MSLPVNNNQKGKKGNTNNKKGGNQGSKFIAKPGGKASGGPSKTPRTGGTRGS